MKGLPKFIFVHGNFDSAFIFWFLVGYQCYYETIKIIIRQRNLDKTELNFKLDEIKGLPYDFWIITTNIFRALGWAKNIYE